MIYSRLDGFRKSVNLRIFVGHNTLMESYEKRKTFSVLFSVSEKPNKPKIGQKRRKNMCVQNRACNEVFLNCHLKNTWTRENLLGESVALIILYRTLVVCKGNHRARSLVEVKEGELE